MIDCGICSNTRKVMYEDEQIDCPVCEEYVAWGKTDELAKHKDGHKRVQNEVHGHGSGLVETPGGREEA